MYLSRYSVAVLLALVTPSLYANVKMPAIFGDHMVLQQGPQVPVWGWADPNEKVTVSIAGQTAAATADSSGKWMVKLGALKADNQTTEMTITGKNTLVLKDILIGEVWICSGQSNMGFPLQHASNAETELPRANDKQLRLFRVTEKVAYEPQSDCTGKWEVCTTETAAPFSAIGYFFGRELQEKHNVPVGVIGSYVGGTPAQAWISFESLQSDPLIKARADEFLHTKTNYAALKEKYEKETLPAWQKRKALKKGNHPNRKPADPTNSQWMPTGLYNGMIAPLTPLAFKGVLWYQGASNKGDAMEYRTLFPAVINDWRKQWGQGNFPFLFIQASVWPPSDKGEYMPGIREAQLMTLSQPVVGMAVSIDLGSAENQHFANKVDVSHRLFLVGEHVAYGKDLVYSGPIFKSMKIEDSTLRLFFEHTGSGLTIMANPPLKPGEPPAAPAAMLKGFVIAGLDMKFVPAQAVIDGNTVVVSSDKVKQPVAVRYAWNDAPEDNLYNKEGLPASPFRTDNLPLPLDAKASLRDVPEVSSGTEE